MAQLTIYLDSSSSRLIEEAANREALSLSRWAREKLVHAAGAPVWPKEYASVLGSISDDTFRAPDEIDERNDQSAEFEA